MFLVLETFENMWAKWETVFLQQKCFGICWDTFSLPRKQILYPPQCFPEVGKQVKIDRQQNVFAA